MGSFWVPHNPLDYSTSEQRELLEITLPLIHMCLHWVWGEFSASLDEGFACLWGSSLQDPSLADISLAAPWSGCSLILPTRGTSAANVSHPYKCFTVCELWRGEGHGLCGQWLGHGAKFSQHETVIQQGRWLYRQLSLGEIPVEGNPYLHLRESEEHLLCELPLCQAWSHCVSMGSLRLATTHPRAMLQNPIRGHSWVSPLTPQGWKPHHSSQRGALGKVVSHWGIPPSCQPGGHCCLCSLHTGLQPIKWLHLKGQILLFFYWRCCSAFIGDIPSPLNSVLWTQRNPT